MSGIKKKKITKHEKKQEKINHKQDKRIIRYKVQNYRDDGIRRMFEKLKIFSIYLINVEKNMNRMRKETEYIKIKN